MQGGLEDLLRENALEADKVASKLSRISSLTNFICGAIVSLLEKTDFI